MFFCLKLQPALLQIFTRKKIKGIQFNDFFDIIIYMTQDNLYKT